MIGFKCFDMKSIADNINDIKNISPYGNELCVLFLDSLKQKIPGRAKVLDDDREIGFSASDFIPRLAVIKYLLDDNDIKQETKQYLCGVFIEMFNMYKIIYSDNKDCIYKDEYLKKNLADAEKRGKIELYVANDKYLVNMFRRNIRPDVPRESAERERIPLNNSTQTMINTYLNKLRAFEEKSNIYDFRNKVIMDNISTALDKEKQIRNVLEFLRFETEQCENFLKKTKEIDKQIEERHLPKTTIDGMQEIVKTVLVILEAFKSGGLDYTKIIKSNKELIKELEAMLGKFNNEANEKDKKSEIKEDDKKIEEKKEVNKNMETKETKKKTEAKKTEESSTGSKINNGVSDDYLMRMMRMMRKKRDGKGY